MPSASIADFVKLDFYLVVSSHQYVVNGTDHLFTISGGVSEESLGGGIGVRGVAQSQRGGPVPKVVVTAAVLRMPARIEVSLDNCSGVRGA